MVTKELKVEAFRDMLKIREFEDGTSTRE